MSGFNNYATMLSAFQFVFYERETFSTADSIKCFRKFFKQLFLRSIQNAGERLLSRTLPGTTSLSDPFCPDADQIRFYWLT